MANESISRMAIINNSSDDFRGQTPNFVNGETYYSPFVHPENVSYESPDNIKVREFKAIIDKKYPNGWYIEEHFTPSPYYHAFKDLQLKRYKQQLVYYRDKHCGNVFLMSINDFSLFINDNKEQNILSDYAFKTVDEAMMAAIIIHNIRLERFKERIEKELNEAKKVSYTDLANRYGLKL